MRKPQGGLLSCPPSTPPPLNFYTPPHLPTMARTNRKSLRNRVWSSQNGHLNGYLPSTWEGDCRYLAVDSSPRVKWLRYMQVWLGKIHLQSDCRQLNRYSGIGRCELVWLVQKDLKSGCRQLNRYNGAQWGCWCELFLVQMDKKVGCRQFNRGNGFSWCEL